MSTVTLESRVAGGPWHVVGAVSPDRAGAFTVEGVTSG